MQYVHQGIGFSTIVSRVLLFSIMWWALTDGAAASWWVGVPAVSFAVIASIAVLPPLSLVWRELLRFTPFFLWRSLQGGADVPWRAFHPGSHRLPASTASGTAAGVPGQYRESVAGYLERHAGWASIKGPCAGWQGRVYDRTEGAGTTRGTDVWRIAGDFPWRRMRCSDSKTFFV